MCVQKYTYYKRNVKQHILNFVFDNMLFDKTIYFRNNAVRIKDRFRLRVPKIGSVLMRIIRYM